jgi:hypothetical protein
MAIAGSRIRGEVPMETHLILSIIFLALSLVSATAAAVPHDDLGIGAPLAQLMLFGSLWESSRWTVVPLAHWLCHALLGQSPTAFVGTIIVCYSLFATALFLAELYLARRILRPTWESVRRPGGRRL